MSRCLCCGKTLTPDCTELEHKSLWHVKCCRRFFGTDKVPELDITEDVLQNIAIQSIEKGYTVPGVQKKLSLHLTEEERGAAPRLTLVDYPTGYILKPQTEQYADLPEAEYLVMQMAEQIGIRTVPFALIRQGEKLAYITKRIDRIKTIKKSKVQMLAMEDFCQLDGKLTQDKYKGSYERCGRIIAKYSVRSGVDMTELFLRMVFSYIVGNSDMHLKNFSLIETAENSREYVLSEAYDLLPVNTILPEDKEQFALTLNGKKRNVTKKDFLIFAENCNINKKVAERLIESILKKQEIIFELCRNSYVSENMKKSLEELMHQRIAIF